VPVHKASLDVGAIYRAEAGRQRQHARRWRWMAGLTASAAAAVIAVAFLSRLEIRVEAHQLTFKWGAPHESGQSSILEHQTPLAGSLPSDLVLREQIQVWSELVQGQREQIGEQEFKLARLEGSFETIQRLLASSLQRWRSTERDVAALSRQTA